LDTMTLIKFICRYWNLISKPLSANENKMNLVES
jgi:hypothetical protein